MSNKIKFSLFLIIVLILVLSFIWLERDEAPNLKWNKGTNLYRFKIDSRTKYLFSGSDVKTDFRLEGDLNFTVLDFDDSIIEAHFTINNVDVFIDYKLSRSVAELYESEFVGKLNKSGKIKSFIFPINYSEEQKAMLKGLLVSFEIVCLGEKQFEIKQNDSTGTYIAQYDYSDKNHVSKKKIGYENVIISNGFNTQGFDVDVKKSNCFFSINNYSFWLKRFEGKEKFVLSVSENHKLAEIETVTSLFYVKSGTKNVKAKYDYEYYTSHYKSLKKDVPEQKLQDFRLNTELDKEKKIETMKDLLSVITNQSLISESDNFKDFLRNNPDLINEIPEFLKSGLMNDKHAYLVGVLGIIGTPEAQNALCTIFLDFSQSYKNRDRAVVALGSLNVPPEPETIDAIEHMLDLIKPENVDNNDIAGASLFSLGIVSSNISKKYREKAEEINSLLELYLEKASNDQQKSFLLGALGNTGSTKSALEIIPFLNSPDKNLRRSAAEALYEPDNDKITKSLLEAMEKENDSLVKSRIIESLSQKKIGNEDADFIAKKSLEESDPDVRRYYIYFISSNKNKIKNLDELIESLLKKETSKNNIKALLEIDSK
jgi:HEAT repeat protein